MTRPQLRWLLLPALSAGFLPASVSCQSRTFEPRSPEQTELRQEADDRETERTAQLADSAKMFSEWVNKIIDETRASNPLLDDDTLGITLVETVYQKLGKKVPGSGFKVNDALPPLVRSYVNQHNISLMDFIPLAEAEVWLEQNLKWERRSGEIQKSKTLGKHKDHINFAAADEKPQILRLSWWESVHAPDKSKWFGARLWQTLDNPTVATTAGADHAMSPTVRFSGKAENGGTKAVLIGIDKWAHFFNTGYLLFKYSPTSEETAEAKELRLKVSQFLEGDPELAKQSRSVFWTAQNHAANIGKIEGTSLYQMFGFLGALSTGVVSQADMAANEYGFQFYRCLKASPRSARFDLNTGSCFDDGFQLALFNEQKNPNTLIKGSSFAYFINVMVKQGLIKKD